MPAWDEAENGIDAYHRCPQYTCCERLEYLGCLKRKRSHTDTTDTCHNPPSSIIVDGHGEEHGRLIVQPLNSVGETPPEESMRRMRRYVAHVLVSRYGVDINRGYDIR